MSNAIITVENLGKKYLIRHEGKGPKYATLRDAVADKAKSILRRVTIRHGNGTNLTVAGPSAEDFWALKDVSFDIKQGEVVGVIGRNGAGKSTLLKVLSRITDPTAGRVTLRGRVASLLEVGTGFHPELTGRENIFLNGAILGMTRMEMVKKFDEIVAFAEVEKFLDTPVKRYSSGMYVRLAFAVAAHLEPEILVVDEVLAVGDIAFQQKCLGKMRQVSSEGGRTVLFVSHNMQPIRELCDRVIMLHQGKILTEGEPDAVISRYTQSAARTDSLKALNEQISELPADPTFRLREVEILQEGESTTDLTTGKDFLVRISYEVLRDSVGLHVWIMLCDMDGTVIFDSLHNGDSADLPLMKTGKYVSTVTIPANFLAGRAYELKIQGSIHGVRDFLSKPLTIDINLHQGGTVNRAYSGYSTAGKIAPLLSWQTQRTNLDHEALANKG